MSSRMTLVELLEHSSNCHAMHCGREDDCREMKQLIYHSLLCKQVACRVCVEVNSFIITHSTSCSRDCCPVLTCNTLRSHALDKERRVCKLSSNSQDLATLQNLKQKCRPSSGVRTKVRGTYQCGRCGMPKIRPHKCASESLEHTAVDSDSEADEDTVETCKSLQKEVNHRPCASGSDTNQRDNSSTGTRSSAIVLTKKTFSAPTHYRPSAAYLSHQKFASTDSEDSHESTSTSSSYATQQSESHTRKRSASSEAPHHAPAGKRPDHTDHSSGHFSSLHEPEHFTMPRREPAPHRVLSRHPSYGSELSEASSTQYSDAEAVQEGNETSDETSEEFQPCYSEPHSQHTELTYPPFPPYAHYPMPPSFHMPPDMWLPPPFADSTQEPSAGYPGNHDGARMVPMQDPFGRWMPMPYWANASTADKSSSSELTSGSTASGEVTHNVDHACTKALVRSASQLRRDRAHRQENMPQSTESVLFNPTSGFPPSQNSQFRQAARSSVCVPRVLPPSDYRPLEEMMPHHPLRPQHLHGHSDGCNHSNLSTSTNISAGSLVVQHHHTPLHTHTSTGAALPSMEESAELEIDFDVFDFSVGSTPQSAFQIGLRLSGALGSGSGSGSGGRARNEDVYDAQEGKRLFQGLSEELVST